MGLEQRYIVFKIADMQEGGIFMRQLAMFAKELREAANKPPLEGVFIEKDWPEYPAVVAMLEERIRKETVTAGVKGVYELHERAQHLAISFAKALTKTEDAFLHDLVMRGIVFGTPCQRSKVAQLEVKYIGHSREKEYKV